MVHDNQIYKWKKEALEFIKQQIEQIDRVINKLCCDDLEIKDKIKRLTSPVGRNNFSTHSCL